MVYVKICVTLLTLAGVALLAGGCAATRTTDPPRTATEQFLLSTAAMEAVGQLSFDNLRGRRVFIDAQYFAASEEQFVLGELRAKALASGVHLMRKIEDAEIVMEVRSAGVGIDRNDYLLGIPPFILGPNFTPGTTATNLVTPEVAISKNLEQKGFAAVSYVAYWAETGEIVGGSGPFLGRSLRDDWWILGSGPRSIGNIPPIEKEN